jgi:hypothetical protein
MKTKDILKLPVYSDSLSEIGNSDLTIKGYLVLLLSRLWDEGSYFSGKRPLGNSDWEYDLYIPLIKAGLVNGEVDEDGYVEEFSDEKKANKIIFDCIESL